MCLTVDWAKHFYPASRFPLSCGHNQELRIWSNWCPSIWWGEMCRGRWKLDTSVRCLSIQWCHYMHLQDIIVFPEVSRGGLVSNSYVLVFMIFQSRIAMAMPQACVCAYYVCYAENPNNRLFDDTIPERIKYFKGLRVWEIHQVSSMYHPLLQII